MCKDTRIWLLLTMLIDFSFKHAAICWQKRGISLRFTCTSQYTVILTKASLFDPHLFILVEFWRNLTTCIMYFRDSFLGPVNAQLELQFVARENNTWSCLGLTIRSIKHPLNTAWSVSGQKRLSNIRSSNERPWITWKKFQS